MKPDSENKRVAQFEKRLRRHKKVSDLKIDGCIYRFTLDLEREMTVYLTDAVQVDDNIFYDEHEREWMAHDRDTDGHWVTHPYVIGQNDVSDILGRYNDDDIDCIVTMSQYNQYTSTAKELAQDSNSELMTADEFFLSLKTGHWL